jgi:hypothetical protein
MIMSGKAAFQIEGISFHHVGLLTDNPAAAVTVLTAFGYSVDEPVTDLLQSVDLRMAHGGPDTARIEIITPRTTESPLARLLRRRSDYMYHSSFCVKNVENTKAALMATGLRVNTVAPPQPAVLFGGAMVSFHVIEGLGLVEFIEYGQ